MPQIPVDDNPFTTFGKENFADIPLIFTELVHSSTALTIFSFSLFWLFTTAKHHSHCLLIATNMLAYPPSFRKPKIPQRTKLPSHQTSHIPSACQEETANSFSNFSFFLFFFSFGFILSTTKGNPTHLFGIWGESQHRV